MKVYMILAPIEGAIDRRDLEQIEGNIFRSENDYTSKDREVLKKVKFEFGIENDEGLEVYELHEFTELSNDDEFDPSSYWIGYIFIK
jgi:hypothetical protein